MLKLSPSSLEHYLQCKRLYYELHEVGGRDRQQAQRLSPAAARGLSQHGALAMLQRLDNQNKTITDEDIKAALSRNWNSSAYDDRDQEDADFVDSVEILKRYLASQFIPRSKILAVEQPLSAFTAIASYHLQVVGKVDRVELHVEDHVLELLDYKTSVSGHILSEEALAHDLTTFLYYLLGWHNYHGDIRVHNILVSQLNIVSLNKVEHMYSQREVVMNKAAFADVVRDIHERSFEPSPGFACKWCPVKSECPAWREMDWDTAGFYE
jgi:hypothetical protein